MNDDDEDDCGQLLAYAVPFALKMLAEDGEFFPFGACVDRDGRIAGVGATDGTEQPPPLELIELLKDGLRAKAADLRATAIVSNVDLTEPDGTTGDAIRIDYEHRDDGPLTVLYPYRMTGGEPSVGEAFTTDAARAIF